MPGSIEKAWPGASARVVALHDVGVLVLLDADAVARAVEELLAVARVGDDHPRGGIDVLARGADRGGGDRRGLRLVQHRVDLGHLGRRLAQVHARVMSEQ